MACLRIGNKDWLLRSSKKASSASSKKKLSKNNHNDDQAPNTTKALLDLPSSKTTSSIGNVIGINWRLLKLYGQKVVDTCAANSLLVIIRTLEKYEHKSVIKRSFFH